MPQSNGLDYTAWTYRYLGNFLSVLPENDFGSKPTFYETLMKSTQPLCQDSSTEEKVPLPPGGRSPPTLEKQRTGRTANLNPEVQWF